jgi:hypothetical protein
MVADGKGEERREGVWIHDFDKPSAGPDRVWNASQHVATRVTKLGADFYHLHDSQVMLARRELRRMKMTIVVDAHHEAPKQMHRRCYLDSLGSQSVAAAVAEFEVSLALD